MDKQTKDSLIELKASLLLQISEEQNVLDSAQRQVDEQMLKIAVLQKHLAALGESLK